MLKLPKIVGIFLIVYLCVFFYVYHLHGNISADLLYQYGFVPISLTAAFSVEALISLFTYSFLHSDITHLMLNGLWFLVFGTAVAREMRSLLFCGFVLWLSTISALIYGVFNPSSTVPMIGASGVVCGLMGASLYIMPQKYWHMPIEPIGSGRYIDVVMQLLRRPQIQQFIIMFHGINVVMAFFPAIFGAQGGIAWEAHIAGFWAGVLMMPLVRSAGR